MGGLSPMPLQPRRQPGYTRFSVGNGDLLLVTDDWSAAKRATNLTQGLQLVSAGADAPSRRSASASAEG